MTGRVSVPELMPLLVQKVFGKFKGAFGQQVRLEEQVDPKILGGIIVRDADTIFDASLRSQLAKLKTHLTA
jgi:F0F1-type ATP synthase delta subunit